MEKYLDGKRVLFICPEFYDYHVQIKRKLENVGASVDFFSESPAKWKVSMYRQIRRTNTLISNHYSSILEKILNTTYNYVFVIRGNKMPSCFLSELRKNNSEAIFLMYQWDSLTNNNYKSIIDKFDKVFTFDIKDANDNFELRYLPLFYTNDYHELINSRNEGLLTTDLFFIGAVGHQYRERTAIVEEISNICLEGNLIFKKYLFIPFYSYLKDILRGEQHNGISFKALNKQGVLTYVNQSKAILDIHNKNQTGLSIRTFESLGAGKKLVTTNADIANADFYNAKNIFLYRGKQDSAKLISFLSHNNEDYLDVQKYRIDNWLRTIFLND